MEKSLHIKFVQGISPQGFDSYHSKWQSGFPWQLSLATEDACTEQDTLLTLVFEFNGISYTSVYDYALPILPFPDEITDLKLINPD